MNKPKDKPAMIHSREFHFGEHRRREIFRLSVSERESTDDDVVVIADPTPAFHRPTSRHPLIRAIFIVLLCAAFYGLGYVFLWRAIIGGVHHGYSVNNIMKNWYLGDQFAYLSITSNVQHGLPAYKEPIMLDGASIYPSGYYWLLGIIGKFTGLTPFGLWNVVGSIMTVGLMTTAGYWGKRMTGHAWGWLVGPLPVLVGTLEWWSSKGWMHQYGGVQAVEWPGYAILINPGAEQFTLTFAAIILLITVTGLRADGTWRWKFALAAGVLQGLILNAHSYIPLLCLITVCMTVLLTQALTNGTSRRALLALACPLIGVGIAAMHIPSQPLGRLVMVVIGLVAPLLIVKAWRQRTFIPLVAYFTATLVFFLPLLLRIAAMTRHTNNYFQFRQHLYDGLDFSIPMRYILKEGAPVLILGALAVFFLWRRRNDDERTRIWIASIVSVGVMSTLMEWNAHWGFGQEPYRFFPYQMILLTIVSAPWLVSRFSDWFDASGRVVAAALLCLTIPTSVAFYNATSPQLLHITPQEQTLFKSVAADTPAQGAVLTDTCIPRMVFKVVTHAAVANIVVGLALPDTYKALDPVLAEQKAGVLASNQDLHAAGITSFLAMNYCKSATSQQENQRFGAPIAQFHLANPALCGLPANTTYSLYRVPASGTQTTSYAPIDPKDPFGTDYISTPQQPLPPVNAPCALQTY